MNPWEVDLSRDESSLLVSSSLVVKESKMSTSLSTRFSQALRPLFTRDPFESLQQEIDSLFDRLRTDGNGGGLTEAMISPLVDLSEKDDSIEIRMDVPGIKAEEIDIQVTGDTIRISGEHKEEKEEKGKTFHRIERRKGVFSRSLALPAAVKEKEVTAECKEGVLTIHLPKAQVVKAQSIKVIAK
jgi:HSP20 family protein